MSAMRVCGWCKKVLEEGTEPATHGICESCEDDVRQEIRKFSSEQGNNTAPSDT